MTVVLTDELTRRASSKDRILAALRAAGAIGCSSHTLNGISFRYGARLLELRAAGHDIESVNEGEGRWGYILHEPARSSHTPQPGSLASLPAVAYIDPHTGLVRAMAPVADTTTPRDGKLF